MPDVIESTKPVAQADNASPARLAVDNQSNGAATRSDATASTNRDLVANKTLPDVSIEGLDSGKGVGNSGASASHSDLSPNNGHSDILSRKDGEAIRAAKSLGITKFDEKFYESVAKTSAGLGDFDAVKASSTMLASHVHKSERLTEKPNGAGEATVKPRDSIWGIAQESLRHNKPEDYKPSNREILEAVKKIARENHLAHPDHIKPGQKIKLPEGMITAPPAQAPEAKPPETKPPEVHQPAEVTKPPETANKPEVPFEVHNASPEFVAEVKRQFESLPENVRRLLANNGDKVVIGGRVSDADPSLRGVQPRGWPAGTTWDDADGLYDDSKRAIVVTETRHDPTTDRFIPNDRSDGDIHHETGYAVDAAMGNASHSDDYKQAYDQDVAAMSPAERQRFSYLIQNGHAGHEEAFAEVFGAINGTSANRSETESILRDFPHVAEYIRRRQAALP